MERLHKIRSTHSRKSADLVLEDDKSKLVQITGDLANMFLNNMEVDKKNKPSRCLFCTQFVKSCMMQHLTIHIDKDQLKKYTDTACGQYIRSFADFHINRESAINLILEGKIVPFWKENHALESLIFETML